MRLDAERSASTKSPRSRWRWTIASLAVLLVVFWWVYSARESEVDGKSLTEWFEEFNNWTSPTGLHTARCYQVFMELEGDALPFLVKRAQTKQTSLDRAYESLLDRLPAFCSQGLPQARSEAWHLNRRNSALQLIGYIGGRQRWKTDSGESSRKPGIQVALPVIQAALQVEEVEATKVFAAQAAWYIGPQAAPLVPDLVKLAADPSERASLAALQSFQLIGPAASNAVPLLIRIATTEGSNRQIHAVQSLGGMGAVAQSAAEAIAPLLQSTNPAVNLAAARSLAQLGVVPQSAVPFLTAMRVGTNEWAARVAALALWNLNREDEELRAEIISALRSPQRGWMTLCLGSLGTNAQPFADEIRRLTSESNEVWRGQAAAALRRIQPPPP